MTELNKAAILEWVEALESGEYQQITGTLAQYRKDGGIDYCCLGVACDVFKNRLGLEVGVGDHNIVFDKEYSSLPIKVQNFLGLRNDDPQVSWENGVTTLTNLNDNLGKTFPEIAAIIRANFLEEETSD